MQNRKDDVTTPSDGKLQGTKDKTERIYRDFSSRADFLTFTSNPKSNNDKQSKLTPQGNDTTVVNFYLEIDEKTLGM